MDDAFLKALDQVVSDVVAPAADEVDRAGAFPRAAIDALGEAGILGLTSPTEVGGGGAGPARRGRGRRAAGRGVRLDRDGRAHALRGDCRDRGARPAPRSGRPSPPAITSPRSRSPRPARAATSGRRSSTATAAGDGVRLDAPKSWVTSAGEADSYVWSSRPLAADGPDDAVAGARATRRV